MTFRTRLLTRASWIAAAFRPSSALVGKVAGLTLAASLAAPVAAPTATTASAATRESTELAFTAAGVDFGYTVGPSDYARARDQFRVNTGAHIDGEDIDRINAALWNASKTRLAVASIGYGEKPDPSDFTDAARWLGVDIGSELSNEDIERVYAAGRARVGRALRAGGFTYGSQVDEHDIRRAAAITGISVGNRLDPQDTRAVIDAAWARADAPLMATTRGVRVYQPTPRPLAVGFHQAASSRTAAMNATTGFKLPSRGRGTAGTSAVDVAMDRGDAVRAPVSGRVVEVRRYSLYGKTPDYKIRIVPDQNPGMLATVLHVVNPRVRVGQHVTGGESILADEARLLPFWSQIDATTGGGRGHVHIELRPR